MVHGVCFMHMEVSITITVLCHLSTICRWLLFRVSRPGTVSGTGVSRILSFADLSDLDRYCLQRYARKIKGRVFGLCSMHIAGSPH